MVHRFTEAARQVIVLAQAEARDLSHDYLGPEHILLGLLREEEGAAARTLGSLDITVDSVRPHLPRPGSRGADPLAETPFTPRAKGVLQLALREAMLANRGQVATEHILLALASDAGGAAARILLDFDADPDRVRAAVIRTLAEADVPPAPRAHDTPSDRIGDQARADRNPRAGEIRAARQRLQADEIRAARQRLKHELRQGTADPVEIFLDPPSEAQTAKTVDLLLALPHWSRMRIHRVLKNARISPSKEVAGLSDRQRHELVGWLRHFSR